MTDGPTRISLWRYSPALVLFAIVIADLRQLSDTDLWMHIIAGREFLLHGAQPQINLYTYSAPGYPWLHHSWLSEVLMAAALDRFGPFGLKLVKFSCTAGTICLMVDAMAETGAAVAIQALVLLVSAITLVPAMQFRPQLFDFLLLAAIVMLLSRHNWRGSAPLWITIPIILLWANLHGGFFIGVIAIGVYGAVVGLMDLLEGRSLRRGFVIELVAAAALASTLLTFAIPPAQGTWHALLHAVTNPMTSSTITDWKPLIASLKEANVAAAQIYFILVLVFFGTTALAVILKPRGSDTPLIAVAAVMVAAAFSAQRNIAIAAIALAPVLANHLSLVLRRSDMPSRKVNIAAHLITEVLIAAAAIVFARSSGVLTPGIMEPGVPSDAVAFMNNHGLKGNTLAAWEWGGFLIWNGAPGTKVFIDSRYDHAYPSSVMDDFLQFDKGKPGGRHTLAAYPHDFVLIKRDWPSVKLMESSSAWRLIYSDDVARLYAPVNSPAARLDGVPFKGTAVPALFP